jgi:ribosomal protein S18 acetylase RimI-like enzyme
MKLMQASNVQLRPMTVADLPAARELWAEADGVELSEGDSVPELTRYLHRNPRMSFVAVSGARIVGALLAGHDGRRGFLYHLAVAPDFRRNHIGRTLVAESLASLKAAEVVRVLLLVSRDNELATQFWSKRGWQPLTLAEPMGLDL